ncbi:MAG: hypothetical protein CL569_15070 [Alphaproteobacteria bacterium]|nr:hypothetical protein [Alphaproteobacteria bacterium]
MTEEESEPTFEFLYEHAVDPRFVYRHKWRANGVPASSAAGHNQSSVPSVGQARLCG